MIHEGVEIQPAQSETMAIKLPRAYQESTSLTHVLLVVYLQLSQSYNPAVSVLLHSCLSCAT